LTAVPTSGLGHCVGDDVFDASPGGHRVDDLDHVQLVAVRGLARVLPEQRVAVKHVVAGAVQRSEFLLLRMPARDLGRK